MPAISHCACSMHILERMNHMSNKKILDDLRKKYPEYVCDRYASLNKFDHM